MAIVMVAMLAFGGTYAYFTDAADGAFSGTTYTGRIELSTNSTFTTTETLTANILPGETLLADTATTFVVTDESNRESYIFFEYSIEVFKATGYDEDGVANAWSTTADTSEEAAKISANLTAGMITADNGLTATPLTDHDGVFYVKTTAEKLNGTYTINLGESTSVVIPTTWDNSFQQAKIVVTFSVNAAQGNLDAATAYGTIA
ncbi:MAG: hypothetical protein IJD48_00100 [Clostridia bacterium]|nr:hypothetical protein [Clostridia bacterium]